MHKVGNDMYEIFYCDRSQREENLTVTVAMIADGKYYVLKTVDRLVKILLLSFKLFSYCQNKKDASLH